jgi:uncharacterized protein YukE
VATVVQMDYTQIENSAKSYQSQADTLKAVAKVLQGVVQGLRASFFGAIFFAQLIKYLEGIQKACEKVASVCEALNRGLLAAEKAHKSGDQTTTGFFQF